MCCQDRRSNLYLAHFIHNTFDVFFVNATHASFGIGEHCLKVGPLAVLGNGLGCWNDFGQPLVPHVEAKKGVLTRKQVAMSLFAR